MLVLFCFALREILNIHVMLNKDKKFKYKLLLWKFPVKKSKNR